MAWYDADLVVTIIDQTFPLALPNLSMPVILDIAPGHPQKNKLVTYNSITSVGVDYDPDTPTYKMFNRIFSQEPHVDQAQAFNITRNDYKKASLKIGSTANDSGLIVSAQKYGASGDLISIALTEGTSLSVSVSGNAITVTFIDGTTTAAQVRSAVNSDTEASKLVVVGLDPDNAAPGTGSGLVSALAATNLSRSNTPDSPVELTRALNFMWDQVAEEDLPQPYFLLSPTRDYDDGLFVPGVTGDRDELADAVSSRLMYYLTGNQGKSRTDANLELPSPAHTLAQNMATDRALIFWHDQSEGVYGEAAIAGLWGAISPGGLTLRWKRLNGVPAAKVNDNDLAILRGQAPGSAGLFSYAKAFGAPVLTGSWSTDGSFADWRRDKDWLRINLQARILFSLRNRPKVLFDARGVSVLKGAVSEILSQATGMGIIAVDEDGNELWDIRTTPIKKLAVLDKARRFYRGMTALIHPAGAIEQVALPVYATFEEFSTFNTIPGF